jgi:phospholipid/cholesterol/gamma-HCH transport system ATP-binding protein
MSSPSSLTAPGTTPPAPRITVADLTMAYGSFIIQNDLSFTIAPGEIFVVMGGSGSGKSTLLNHMVGLRAPAKGDVLYDGQSLCHAAGEERDRLRRRLGVSYQAGALWSSMTLAENVALPLQTFTKLSSKQIREIVALKLALVDQRWDAQACRRGAGDGARSGHPLFRRALRRPRPHQLSAPR